MRKLLLFLLITTGLNAQITLTVSGTTYQVTGSTMINTINDWTEGYEVGWNRLAESNRVLSEVGVEWHIYPHPAYAANTYRQYRERSANRGANYYIQVNRNNYSVWAYIFNWVRGRDIGGSITIGQRNTLQEALELVDNHYDDDANWN